MFELIEVNADAPELGLIDQVHILSSLSVLAWTALHCSGTGVHSLTHLYAHPGGVHVHATHMRCSFGILVQLEIVFPLYFPPPSAVWTFQAAFCRHNDTQGNGIITQLLFLWFSHTCTVWQIFFFRFWLELEILIPVRIPRLCLIPVPV